MTGWFRVILSTQAVNLQAERWTYVKCVWRERKEEAKTSLVLLNETPWKAKCSFGSETSRVCQSGGASFYLQSAHMHLITACKLNTWLSTGRRERGQTQRSRDLLPVTSLVVLPVEVVQPFQHNALLILHAEIKSVWVYERSYRRYTKHADVTHTEREREKHRWFYWPLGSNALSTLSLSTKTRSWTPMVFSQPSTKTGEMKKRL